jgi:hypothetical protein
MSFCDPLFGEDPFDEADYDPPPAKSLLCRQERCDYCHDPECICSCHQVTVFPARQVVGG